MAFVVILQNNTTTIAVPEHWALHPIVNEQTVIFISPNKMEHPNFSLKTEYHLQNNSACCYNGRVVAEFGKFTFNFTNR